MSHTHRERGQNAGTLNTGVALPYSKTLHLLRLQRVNVNSRGMKTHVETVAGVRRPHVRVFLTFPFMQGRNETTFYMVVFALLFLFRSWTF